MKRKLTEEQTQWIINHDDYPSWVIVENFKEKFGVVCPVTKTHINNLRWKAKGSSNRKHFTGRGSRNTPGSKHQTDGIKKDAEFYGHKNEDLQDF